MIQPLTPVTTTPMPVDNTNDDGWEHLSESSEISDEDNSVAPTETINSGTTEDIMSHEEEEEEEEEADEGEEEEERTVENALAYLERVVKREFPDAQDIPFPENATVYGSFVLLVRKLKSFSLTLSAFIVAVRKLNIPNLNSIMLAFNTLLPSTTLPSPQTPVADPEFGHAIR
jgi:histone deacetylase complex regulatory component SIN3